MERGKFRDGNDFKRESLEENCGTSVEETRPNSRGALSTEIPGRLAPLENRLAAVRVGHPRGRSAIKPSRSDREIFARDRGHSRTVFSSFLQLEIQITDWGRLRGERDNKWLESDKCVSKGGAVGEVLEMSATAGLPSSSKQPDNYGEPYEHILRDINCAPGVTDFSSDRIDISWLDLELFFQFFFTQFSYLQTSVSKRFKKKESFVENPIVTKQSMSFLWACFRKYCEGKFFNYIGMERGSVRNFATLARKRNAPSLYSDKFRSKNKRTAPGTGTRTTLAGPGNLDFSDSYRHFCVTTHSRIPSGAWLDD